MPADVFHNMSDSDVQAVVAYLRSQPATEPTTPPTQFNFVGNLLAATLFGNAFTAQPHITQPVVAPPAGVTKEYGQYLVSIAGCRSCHGANLAGGVIPDGSGTRAPNLTLVIPAWSQDQFLTFFRTGTLPGGKQVSEAMPWQEMNRFAGEDGLKAMYEYLRTLPPTPK